MATATKKSLAQSGSFASQSDAERAARCVYDGAGSARCEPHVAALPRLADQGPLCCCERVHVLRACGGGRPRFAALPAKARRR